MTDNSQRFASEFIPSDFLSWRYCIEVKCGINLTQEYVNKRIAILEDPHHEESRRFEKLYGRPYREQVLGWFQRVSNEV